MGQVTRHPCAAQPGAAGSPWRTLVAAIVALAVSGAGAGAAAPDALPAPQTPPAAFTYKGAELCVRCHRSEQSEWCDTATTGAWRHDAHSRAHLALLPANPRTRAMEEALGITAATTASCVACHTQPAAEPAPEEAIPEETNRFLHGGISCETCHGPGSGYFEPHLHANWRFLPAADKARHGMVDLRDPVLKTENCLGCHLGDARTGRVVPHAAYAAGHPPLNAFEVEAASVAMGPHWKRVWEKSERIQGLAATADYHTEAASTAHRSLIGALVALKRSALVVQQAAETADSTADARPTGAGSAWPELALYDCQACHHDLVLPSRRQQVGYGGLVPGRPGLVRWPRRLAEAAFAVAEMPTAADDIVSPWVAALNGRPFGHPDDLRGPAGAGNALARVDAAIAALAAVRRDDSLPARERQITIALATAGQRCTDLDSARPVGWVLSEAIRHADGWTPAERDLVRARLDTTLGLGIPGPPPRPDDPTPFWRLSLDAAAAYDPDVATEAFRLPAARPDAAASPRSSAAPSPQANPLRPVPGAAIPLELPATSEPR
jgi:hypothetical protein